jgi:predicted O-methyltransferase YrrM
MADARHPAESRAEGEFDAAWSIADSIPGWLTRAQGQLLWESARAAAPGSTIVEIGSHQGRSTVVLGLAARLRGSRVVAIDPFVDGPMFGGSPTRVIFEAHVRQAGLDGTVDLLPVPSQQARRTWKGDVGLLYIDGKHDYWTVMDDVRWSAFLAPGARVLIHDAFCSVGVTSALLDWALLRGNLRYLSREGTLAVFDLARPGTADRRAFLDQVPWFLRNVTIKASLRVRAKPLLRALGHDSPVDPY